MPHWSFDSFTIWPWIRKTGLRHFPFLAPLMEKFGIIFFSFAKYFFTFN